MRIREAKQSEIGRLAFIGARAFYKDDIYAHFYPQRQLYPEAFYEGILASLLNIFTQPGAKLFVAECEDSDVLPNLEHQLVGKKIIGYLTLVFHGSPEQKAQFDSGNQEKAFYGSLLELEKQRVPNKAIDQTAIDDFMAKQRAIISPIGCSLEAVSFAILPEFQSMGYGIQFLTFLQTLIDKLGVDAVADASKRGNPIYEKFGTKHIGNIELPAKTIQMDDSSIIHLPKLTVPVRRLLRTPKAAL